MSNRARRRKTVIKEHQNALIKIRAVEMYFDEYDLEDHFIAYLEAKANKEDLPPKLVKDE